MFREIDASRYADCPFDARARLGLLLCENNAMTVGWGLFGILWQQPTAALFVRPSRYTDTLLTRTRRATLCFLGEEHADALALCGKHSGREFLGGSGADAAGAGREKESRAGGKLLRAGLTPITLVPGGDGGAFPAAEVRGDTAFPAVAEAAAALCLETGYAAPLEPERLGETLTRRFYPDGDFHKLYLFAVRAVFLRV